MARHNPTIHDIVAAEAEIGPVTAPKVPKIGDWRRTPKQRGLKQGYLWAPSGHWRPPGGAFYIFPAPNKRSNGATRFWYVTNGVRVLSTQHRTKSEAVKALKGMLSGVEAQLRVNPPNPLTRDEAAELDRRRSVAEDAGQELSELAQDPDLHPDQVAPLHRGLGEREGYAHGMREVARDFGPRSNPAIVEESTGIMDVYDAPAANPPLKRKRKRAAKRAAPGELSAPQKRLLTQLKRAAIAKDDVEFRHRAVLAALKRRKLVSELKTKWKITAKGRKAAGGKSGGRSGAPKAHRRAVGKVRSGAARKPRKKSKKKPKKKSKKKSKKRQSPVMSFTVPLERGKQGAKCKVSYPRKLFKNREEALRNIQRELRAKFTQLKKAPVITSCTWRYSDQARTRGRWHFTAKGAGRR